MRHFIIGGHGLIGTAVRAELDRRCEDYGYTSRRGDARFLDLTKPIPDDLPDAGVVYLVAAMPGFATCEGNGHSWIVNVDAQIGIARQYRDRSFVVYVSSDAVEWCGGTAYARQKAQVESYINAIEGAVVRPTRVPPDMAPALAAMLIDVGNGRKQGTHRWKP